MTTTVKIVEVRRPKMIDQARPEKIGSSVMTQLPSRVVPAVSRMGLVRTATLRMIAYFSGRPSD